MRLLNIKNVILIKSLKFYNTRGREFMRKIWSDKMGNCNGVTY